MLGSFRAAKFRAQIRNKDGRECSGDSLCCCEATGLGPWVHPPTSTLLILWHRDITTPLSTSALSTEANLMCLASSGQRAWIPQLFLTVWPPRTFPFLLARLAPLKLQGPPMPVARLVLTVKEAGEVFFLLVWALGW